jgi:hypothetical protein
LVATVVAAACRLFSTLRISSAAAGVYYHSVLEAAIDGAGSLWDFFLDYGLGLRCRSRHSFDRCDQKTFEIAKIDPPSNQTMKPTAPLPDNFSLFATTPCRGLSLSR